MKDVLAKAIQMLLEQDLYLLQVDAAERTITHRLACHLGTLIADYHVDCEYNRNQQTIKVLQSSGFKDQHVFPDIIVHKRGTDDNQLVIEAKKSTEPDHQKNKDRCKLRAFVKDLGYRFAAFLVIRTGNSNPGIDPPEWIQQ